MNRARNRECVSAPRTNDGVIARRARRTTMTAHRRGSGLRSLSLLVGQSSRRCGTQAARVDRTAPNATMEGAGALVASVGRVAASGSATRRASGSSACASGRPWRPATALVGAPRSGARRADVRGSFAVSAVATGGGERRARGDGAGPARRSRASLANGDGARASSRGSSPRDTSPAGEDRRAPRRGAGAPGASRASAPGSASGDDADAAPRSRASSRDAGSARVALARDGRAASPDTPARRDANPPESAPRRRARDLARGSRDENEGRAAAATARLRSGAMKSPVATAALSSVRVAREARAPSTASRSAKTSRTRASAAATANATAAASANASAVCVHVRRISPPLAPLLPLPLVLRAASPRGVFDPSRVGRGARRPAACARRSARIPPPSTVSWTRCARPGCSRRRARSRARCSRRAFARLPRRSRRSSGTARGRGCPTACATRLKSTFEPAGDPPYARTRTSSRASPRRRRG